MRRYPLAINAELAAAFTTSDDSKLITLTSGKTVTMIESFDPLAELLGAEGPQEC